MESNNDDARAVRQRASERGESRSPAIQAIPTTQGTELASQQIQAALAEAAAPGQQSADAVLAALRALESLAGVGGGDGLGPQLQLMGPPTSVDYPLARRTL